MAQPLEDLVSCPVCFEIYTDPQILSCLHVLCKQCTEKLRSDDDNIECPNCRDVCAYEHVKKDFNKQKLVDVYLNQQKIQQATLTSLSAENVTETVHEETGIHIFKCQGCSKLNKVVCRCAECDKYICESCQQDHQRFPALVNHRFQNIDEITSKIKSGLQGALPLLQALKIKLSRKLIDENNLADELNNLKLKSIEDINQRRKALKDKIDEQHDLAIKKVEEDIAQDLTSNVERKQVISNFLNESDAKSNLVTDLSNTADTKALVENGTNIQRDVKLDIAHINSSIDRMKHSVFPTITLTGPKKWEVTDGTLVAIDRSLSHKHVFEKKDSDNQVEPSMHLHSQCGIGFSPNRLHSVDDMLWVTADDGLYIYNTQYCLMKTIKYECIKVARSIVKDSDGKIVVGCDGNQGLFQLDEVGNLCHEISEGSFSDVVIHNGMLYSLLSRQATIKVFVLQEQVGWFMKGTVQWMLRKSIQLRYSNPSATDTLCVDDNYIYVSSFDSDCILRYDHNGLNQKQFGRSGKGEAGRLWGPRICGLDPDGNVMVADCYGQSYLQLCSPAGEWKLLQLEGRLKRCKDAVFDSLGHLWVCTGKDELVHFTNFKCS